MLKSVSYMQTELDSSLLYDIWEEIEKLERYFYKFAKSEAPEAMQAVLSHALTHFNPEKGTLNVYIKSLARTVSKQAGKEVALDFLEDTLEDGEEYLELSDKNIDNAVHTSSSDFSEDIVRRVDSERYRKRDVVEYALMSMDKFLILCEAIIRRDTTTTYYPDAFIKETLKLSGKYKDFNEMCLEIYAEFNDEIKWFLGLDKGNSGSPWKEADFSLIEVRTSKRIALVNQYTEEPVLDADIEDYQLKGSENTLNTKKIYKVSYSDLWNKLCDMVDDTQSNEIKYIIDSSYIVRTLGGSLQLNADLYNMYDLIRSEIVTNILTDTGCRLLHVGSECVYLIQDEKISVKIPVRHVKNIDIQFEVTDITNSIERYKPKE